MNNKTDCNVALEIFVLVLIALKIFNDNWLLCEILLSMLLNIPACIMEHINNAQSKPTVKSRVKKSFQPNRVYVATTVL